MDNTSRICMRIRLDGAKEYIRKMRAIKAAIRDVRREVEQLNESLEKNTKLLNNYTDSISNEPLQ